MASNSGFDLFISDVFQLYDRLVEKLATDRSHVIAASRRALSVLKACTPQDDGEEILLETAIEQFQELIRRAGGR